jgi:hypothetical protein
MSTAAMMDKSGLFARRREHDLSVSRRRNEFLKLEYATLRGESIKRVEFRQRLIEIAVVSAGAILALNLTWDQYPLILLVYPIVVLFLGLGWMHHDQRLQKLATYIRIQIEPEFQRQSNAVENPVGYETWLDHDRARQEGRIGGMSNIAVFLLSQLLVFAVRWASAGSKIGESLPEAIACRLGFSAIYVTAMFLLFYRRLPGPDQWADALGRWATAQLRRLLGHSPQA